MRIYSIKVNGKKYEVQVMGISEAEPVEVKAVKAAAPAPKAEAPAPAPTSGKGEPVLCPMQGTVLEIKVKAGDAVKAGQTLLILEAMKLENEIKAPRDGKVAEIKVAKGASANNKDVLLILE